ncbi:hypothetical protein [Streptomyces albidoflavus]|uniref:hypothetical protein n=1 Tax=Streptomyces albidoflavus TaxID=1886 RepID=UPI001F5D9745|nr:hypothetical protein [Streptomyces albidoflavus]
MLYTYAQLAPATAAHIHREFALLLDSAAGGTALLVVCAELLQSASRGDHPELTPRLRALVGRC